MKREGDGSESCYATRDDGDSSHADNATRFNSSDESHVNSSDESHINSSDESHVNLNNCHDTSNNNSHTSPYNKLHTNSLSPCAWEYPDDALYVKLFILCPLAVLENALGPRHAFGDRNRSPAKSLSTRSRIQRVDVRLHRPDDTRALAIPTARPRN